MALVLIKEDGTGRADANSYASATDAEAYWSFSPWGMWSGNTPDQKVQSLVLASRLIDALYQFHGGKARADQALQWPRVNCPDPDNAGTHISGSSFVPDNFVPIGIVQATCELAKHVMAADRTASHAGEGIDTISTSETINEWTDSPATGGTGSTTTNSSSTKYDKKDIRPIITPLCQAMLSKYGFMVNSGTSVASITRV